MRFLNFSHKVQPSAITTEYWHLEATGTDNPFAVKMTYKNGIIDSITGYDEESEQVFHWYFSKRGSSFMTNGLGARSKPSNVLKTEGFQLSNRRNKAA